MLLRSTEPPEFLTDIIDPENIGSPDGYLMESLGRAERPNGQTRGRYSGFINKVPGMKLEESFPMELTQALASWQEGTILNIGAGDGVSLWNAAELADAMNAKAIINVDPLTMGDFNDWSNFSPLNVTEIYEHEGFWQVMVKCEGLQFVQACVRNNVAGAIVSGIDKRIINSDRWHQEFTQRLTEVIQPGGALLTRNAGIRPLLDSEDWEQTFREDNPMCPTEVHQKKQ